MSAPGEDPVVERVRILLRSWNAYDMVLCGALSPSPSKATQASTYINLLKVEGS